MAQHTRKVLPWMVGMRQWRSPQCLCVLIFQSMIIFFGSLMYLGGYHLDAYMYLSYLTRPIWDSSASNNFIILPHYHAEGIPMDTLCHLHNWTYNNSSNRVIDAFMVANELDLLEIRLKELMPVVDIFFIVESDKTFTNKPKKTLYQENKHRFAFAAHKIVYGLFNVPYLTSEEAGGKNNFKIENSLRNYVTSLLKSNGVRNGDYVIMSDVDEIPTRHTIALFKNCNGMPDITHLAMRYYLYSFEFPTTHQAGFVPGSQSSYTWRPQIHKWDEHSFYTHALKSQYLLVESGWHCSFCFRYIEDFIFKMTAYSHSDRVRHPEFLDPERVQRVVCQGTDMFDMPPESFTYYDLIMNWPAPPKAKFMVNMPTELVEHPEKYKFLLPDNCIREQMLCTNCSMV